MERKRFSTTCARVPVESHEPGRVLVAHRTFSTDEAERLVTYLLGAIYHAKLWEQQQEREEGGEL